MADTVFHAVLYKIDHSQNMARYYTLSIQPDLFGGYTLIRNWGRIGTRGQLRIEFYDTHTLARDASARVLLAKQERGYRTAGWSQQSKLR